MKKNKNIAFIVLLALLVIIGVGVTVVRLLQDENQLTVTEKRYITENKSNLISINVINDANVFGKTGKGVYYDFLSDFEDEYDLSFNIVTTAGSDSVSNLSLTKGTSVNSNDEVFYTDHYVLVSKNYVALSNIQNVTDTIGVLTSSESIINTYLSNYSLTIKNYESKDDLINGLKNDEVSYVIVPMIEYLDTILDNLYYINYHFSDIKDYYYMVDSDNETLTSILSKFFNVWSEEKLRESFNSNEFSLFTENLKITEKELDVIDSKEYTYGFVTNAPYDVKSSGSFGGIANMYVEAFSDFSGITFNYKEYKNLTKLLNAYGNGKVNLFTNYYNISGVDTNIESIYTVDISIVMNNSDERVFKSLNSLKNEIVYVKENSNIGTLLQNQGITVSTYKTDKDITKLLKSNKIVAMDYMNYLVYKDNNKDASSRFIINSSSTYNFISNNDTMFNRLFTYYISTLDKNSISYLGLNNYNKTVKSGKIIYRVTKYTALIILIIVIVSYVVYKFGKRVHIKKKIKRADKIKYIDMLTSLKNRNFLNENLTIWNQNTIYPQSIIVLDLNGLQELNDSYGYQEGDKQIQAAANALIKTQLDNSEIMRTDGNEFTIYLVGYSEKHILSYIKKLNKEFKNLPYDRGAAFGFSMIEDDLKLIDDAINEATERMKQNKELMQGESDDKKL